MKTVFKCYMSEAMKAKLAKVAKKQKTSMSKVIQDLLKKNL